VGLSDIAIDGSFYIGRTLAAIGGTSMLQNLTTLTISGSVKGSAPGLASALQRMPVLRSIDLRSTEMDGPAALAIAAHASSTLRKMDNLDSYYLDSDEDSDDDAVVDQVTMFNTVGTRLTDLSIMSNFSGVACVASLRLPT
jgi:hypothetical protein